MAHRTGRSGRTEAVHLVRVRVKVRVRVRLRAMLKVRARAKVGAEAMDVDGEWLVVAPVREHACNRG